ncbi:MAG: DUF6498-containing protein [bacterium]|nr:DUF6498-containing protein [bacterium]
MIKNTYNKKEFSRPSTIALVAANMVPVYGVFFLGWTVFPLMLLFWLENIIMGFFNILRLIICSPGNIKLWFAKIFFIPFFCVHYGMFTAIHGIFIIVLFGRESLKHSPFSDTGRIIQIVKSEDLTYAIFVLFLSHAFSYFWNFVGKKEYLKYTPEELMTKPYGRIAILHITIILGGFFAMAFRSAVPALILLIVIKIIADVNSHIKDHSRG